MIRLSLASATSALVAYSALVVLLSFLRRHLVDAPTPRSSHTVPTPRGGGVALIAGGTGGLIVAALLGVPADLSVALIIAILVLAAIGLADDRRSLGIAPRLGAQAVAGVLVSLSVPESTLAYGWLPLVALFVMGVVNAFNFMDGVNGISGLVSIVSGLWYAWLGHEAQIESVIAVGVCLAGAAAGFLVLNLRGQVFLGDVGSYAIGGTIASLAVMLLSRGTDVLPAVAPLVIYAVDTGWTMAARTARGHIPGEAHHDHAYQRLSRSLGHVATGSFVAVLTGVCCLMTGWEDPATAIGWSSVAGVYLLLPALLARTPGRVR